MVYYGRGGLTLSKTFVETSTHLLEGIDEMVREGFYANRSEAVNEAISLLLKQYKISKLHAKDAMHRGKTGQPRE
jgi:Arc/MetJ-type ribon-helix-helix transcriptional regulator